MELRFAQRARATKDLDIGIAGHRANCLQSLFAALQLGFDQFTIRLRAHVRDMEQADTIRVQVAVQYRTRSWQTIEVDLGPIASGEVELIEPNVHGLRELQIPVVSPIRCLSLADQIAQKLHACTGPSSAGRARDILDILLIDLLGQLDYEGAAEAARRVFAERGTHTFPPTVVIAAEWDTELESMARDLDFPIRTAQVIERRFIEVVDRLNRAGVE